LLQNIITNFDQSALLDVDLLQGLVQLMQSAPHDSLLPEDLVRVLSILRIRLQGTHQQSSVYPYHLTLAISRVLDIMADHKVKNLDRVLEHEPLSGALSGLKGNSDPYLMYQACYAFQALQYIPDDETALRAVLRQSTGIVDGLAKISAVFKLDIGALLESLDSLQEELGGAIGTAFTAYKGSRSLLESGRGILESVKEGLGSGQKRSWYVAIRAANALVQAGQLSDLNKLIYEAPCRRDPLFQWGICQLLGEIASDSIWDTTIRQQAVDLLGELYRNDSEWGRDESVKIWMLNIISQLGAIEEQTIRATSHTLLKELGHEQDTVSCIPYPLRNRLSLPTSSPTLARIQNIPYLEYDLHKLRLQRLEEHRKGVYIPPQAKPNLQATDDTLFPLMEKALEFLKSSRQVMLVLGDSGSGKSTFNLELEHTLWKTYKKGGPIPLYINLPAIDNPAQEVVEKQLQYYNFSSDQIQEMKLHRELILICDGYDESQLKINLHSTNLFNQTGQWKVKMVISCRSQYLGQDYRSRFQPQLTDRYQQSTSDLFQEAVVAAFSRAQIQQYVEEYVKRIPTANPVHNKPSWTAEEYMDKLVNIPHLMDLVSNPFLLTMALDTLPSVVGYEEDLSAIRITRVLLYDNFVKQWLEVNRMRLEQSPLSDTERSELELLIEDNFLYHGTQFQRDLSTAIFTKHKGNPVVKYTPLRDKNTWKAAFFRPDGHVKLLRESSTVMRTGVYFRFLHRSLLEYFYSRTIYDPRDYDTNATEVDREPSYNFKTCLALMNLVNEPQIIQFLADRVRQDSHFQQQLLEAIEESKADTGDTVAATNAITILIRAGVSFNGANLQGIKVPGADLTGGQFDSAQLQGADLKGVNLSKSWLRQADMSDAQMEGARFGELPYLETDDSVNSCAYSPDGKMFGVAVSSEIVIYDASTWTEMHLLEGHTGTVKSIAFSPDSQRLVSGSDDKTVRLWDTTNAEELFTMRGHSRNINSVAYSPCGSRIASASNDKTVRLWDIQTGETLCTLKGHKKWVKSVQYSPDGRQVLTGSWDGMIRCWDAETGAPGAVLSPSFGNLNSLAFSPDGRWIAAGHANGDLRLWNTISLEPGLVLSGHTNRITGINFSTDSRWVASSSDDYTVRLWDVSTGSLTTVLTGHNNLVKCIAISPDDQQIASGGEDCKVRLWEVGSGCLKVDPPIGSRVTQLAYSCDGQTVLSHDMDGIFRQWNAATGASAPISHKIPMRAGVTSRTYALDGSQLAFGLGDGRILLWNCHTNTAGPVLKGHSKQIRRLDYSPCGHWIVSVDISNSVRLWDLHDLEQQHLLVDIDENLRVNVMAFSSTGGQVAIGTLEGTVYLFDTHSSERWRQVKLNEGILSMAYSPNGQQIAIGTEETKIHLWDIQSEKPVAILEGHRYDIQSVAYSPNGQWIASGSSDKTVSLWQRRLSSEVESWSRVYTLCSFFDYVEHVAWNPVVPMEFVTSTYDGSVQAWRISIDEDGMVIRMVWGANLRIFCAEGATFTNAVGLDPISQELLDQRGALCLFEEQTFPEA
jgi:WD40 repeat protein